MPTDAEIEAAAKALAVEELGCPTEQADEFWNTCFDGAKDRYRGYARAVLKAAERVRKAKM